MSRYQSPRLFNSCGCGSRRSRRDDSYRKDDVQSYRQSKYDYYSDEKRRDDYYDYFYEELRPSYSRNRCNCWKCQERRRRKTQRLVCHCRPYED